MLSFPICFSIGLTHCCGNPLRSGRSEPVISSLDSGRSSAGQCLRRGDPFSHPSGSSARRQVRATHPPFEPKGTGGLRPGPVPSGSWFCPPPEYLGPALASSVACRSVPAISFVGACSALTCRAGPQIWAGRPARPTRYRESRKRVFSLASG